MDAIRSLVTVALFVLYVLLLWRSFRGGAAAEFRAAAQLPFEGEAQEPPAVQDAAGKGGAVSGERGRP